MAKTIRVLIEADGKTYDATLDRATRRTKQFGGETRNTAASVSHMSGVMRVAAGVIASIGMARLAREILQANIELQRITNTLTAATGSSQAAGEEMAFLREEAERLGLDLRATAQGYAQFAAATRETALEGELTREIFLGVVEATTAMGLSAEQTQGALTALEQIVSKGRVSAEELRQQLGERIPGAFRLAAQSIGVTTAELDKMLEQGQLTAEDLLPSLARELRRTFGGDAQRAADNLQQEINRLNNAFFDIMSGGDVEGLSQSIGDLADTLADPGVRTGLQNLITGLADLTEIGARAAAKAGEIYTGLRLLADLEGGNEIVDISDKIIRLRREIEHAENEWIRSPFAAFEVTEDGLGFVTRQEELQALREELREAEAQLQSFLSKGQSVSEARGNLARYGILQRNEEDFSLRDPSRPLIFPREGTPRNRTEPDEGRQDAIDAAEEAIAKLEKELALMGRQTQLERLNAQIRLGAYEDAEPHQIERLRQLAREIDAKQQLQDLQEQFRDTQQRIIEDTSTAAELERRRYEQEMALLREAEEKKLEAVTSYQDLRERARERHEARLAEIAKDGAEKQNREIQEQLQRIENAALDVFANFEDAIIRAAKTGELAWGDMVDAMLEDLGRLLIQQQVTQPLASAIGNINWASLFSGGPGYTTSTAPDGYTVATPGGHGGAVIGHEASSRHHVDPAVFDGARRYHRGGLLGDEIPFIGRRGEGVFTEEQMKRLAPVDAANSAPPPMEVRIYNQGEPVSAERTRQRRGPDGRQIYELWLGEFGRDLGRNGRAAQLMQGTFPNLNRGGARR